jgi:hypothetical protein
MQINASKSKEMQGRLLLFPCIPFADSGLFNGLRRKKIKNFSWILSRSLGCIQSASGRSQTAHCNAAAGFCPYEI